MSNLIYRSLFVTAKNKDRYDTPYQPFGEDDEKIEHAEIWLSDIMSGTLASMIYHHKIFKNASPCFCFDSKEPSWRYNLFPNYKDRSNEKEKTPEEQLGRDLAHVVMDVFHDFLSSKSMSPALRVPHAEGDDIISRFTQIYDTGDVDLIIISGDSDFEQLVSKNISLFKPIPKTLTTIHGNYTLIGNKMSKQVPENEQQLLYGKYWSIVKDAEGNPVVIDPSYQLFEKCIRGDTSDTIPSSYPRVRTKKMKEAFYGGTEEYNNFINSTYGPKKLSVREGFERNKKLIDLSIVPEDITDQIDQVILKQLTKRKNRWIGIDLSKFCKEHNIHREVATSQVLVRMLSTPPILP